MNFTRFWLTIIDVGIIFHKHLLPARGMAQFHIYSMLVLNLFKCFILGTKPSFSNEKVIPGKM